MVKSYNYLVSVSSRKMKKNHLAVVVFHGDDDDDYGEQYADDGRDELCDRDCDYYSLSENGDDDYGMKGESGCYCCERDTNDRFFRWDER